MFEPGTYVDPAVNYENAAQAWAHHLDKPFPCNDEPEKVTMCVGLIHALFRNVYPETIEAIEVDPNTFSERVAAYRHNLSMQHTQGE
jgi:hypothetical protein